MLVEPAGGNGVFVKGDAMFLIFDDLTVLRSSPSVSFKPPLQLGHKEFRKVEEKSLDVDTNKVIFLFIHLRWYVRVVWLEGWKWKI